MDPEQISGRDCLLTDKIKESARSGSLDALLDWAREIKKAPEAEKLISAAERGGADACYELGRAIGYSIEKIFKQDEELEELWLKKAAALHHAGALDILGDNAVIRKKYAEAAQYYAAAGKNGCEMSNLKYAYCMVLGLGVEKNVSGGFIQLRKISENRKTTKYGTLDPESFGAAMAAKDTLEFGTVDQIFSMTLLIPQKESYEALKNKNCTCNIADLEHHFTGERISEKYTLGASAYIKLVSPGKLSAHFIENKDKILAAARDGDIPSLIEWTRNTRVYGENTKIIDVLFKKLEDPKENEFIKFKCYDLGTALKPNPADEQNELYVLWYKKALELGSRHAGGMLGGIYMKRKDYETGLKYYKAAAPLGCTDSRLTCALCLLFGIGTPQNKEAGYRELKEIALIKDDGQGGQVSRDAQKAVEQGTLKIRYIISVLGDAAADTLHKNEDGTVNIADLADFFSRVRVK